jgi:predicted AAA+ superfamily ATPase
VLQQYNPWWRNADTVNKEAKPCDNPVIKMVNVEDVLGAYEALYPIKGDKYLFLDEIQYTADWELWMKVIYDSRNDIKLTATGSASPINEKGASDSGKGVRNYKR